MSETKKGSRKAPRTHQKHWKDNTRNERQNSRSAKLNRIAGEAGYYNKKGEPSWSAFETAVINGKTRLTPLALDGAAAPKASGDLPADVLDGEGTLPEPPRQ